MLGPAFCLTVLDRVVDGLKTGSAADQSQATLLIEHRAFACLGAIGPLLRDYTPLAPEDFAAWEETAALNGMLDETGIAGLGEEELSRLITLHRRAMMVGYGSLFQKVQKQWPLLADARALLDELDAIAADEDLLALNARKDDIEALGDALKGDDEGGGGEGGADDGDGEAKPEPFSYERERLQFEELNVLFRPFIQSEPSAPDDGDDPAAATVLDYAATLPPTWREAEVMRWRASGEFARALLANAGDDARLRAYALGYQIHIAAAVTGQPFFNAITGGPPRSHWWRHRLVSNYVDAWVWGYYGAGATMAGDIPDPPYEAWPELCSANLHHQIDLGLGLSGMAHVDALLGQTGEGAPVASPQSADLDLLAEFLATTTQEVYEPFGPNAFFPDGLDHDFSAEAFRRAYLGLSAVLWLQTSGEGPVCPRPLEREAPDDCYENPPDWVEEFEGPLGPSNHRGKLAGAIILAILALLSAFTAGLGAGLAALAAAAGTAVAAADTFWKELRCTLYWTRYMVHQIEAKTAAFLVEVTLLPPTVARLGGLGDIAGTPGPARDSEGHALTRTGIPDASYPRQMNRGPDGAPHAPDIGYRGYPVNAPAEGPEQAIWPSIGANRYASFALDGEGQWIFQNGGILGPVDFPSSTGSANEPLFFGNAVDNALDLLRNGPDGLENFNLDADRGYGWLAWGTPSPELAARPPIDATNES
ncbi:hypothetical protein KUV47_00460 [Vannielia litorea]|uniref:hypothetical protein n=1 Tax=Vannielia litorea TaxID=1217970 RepID=UPI001C95CEDC|nr:hypothetical protein [Vannielia litorea]MBY6151668.1 hypothetical protein [Vannielia litorea]